MIEPIVKKFGNSLGVSLPASLRHRRNIDVGTHVEIVENGSDLVINTKKVPFLKEMLAQCDLSAERQPDLVAFESSPPVGRESI